MENTQNRHRTLDEALAKREQAARKRAYTLELIKAVVTNSAIYNCTEDGLRHPALVECCMDLSDECEKEGLFV